MENQLEWIAYCITCNKELEKCSNGSFSDGAARHHKHHVIVGYNLKIDNLELNKRTEIIVHGSNLPVCPKCKNDNAMFDHRYYDPEKEKTVKWYACRDCNHTIDADRVELVFMKLDKKSQGNNSTYHEVKRVKGENWI